MKRYEIVPSRHWKNLVDGRTASIYGACPYVSDADKQNWVIVENGFTIADNKSGTVGMGRAPFTTEQAAQDHMDAYPMVFRNDDL